jgi:serine protease Do
VRLKFCAKPLNTSITENCRNSISGFGQAEKDGFQVGDVIIQIENHTITSVSDLKEALRKSKEGAKRVYVNRNGMILLLIAN